MSYAVRGIIHGQVQGVGFRNHVKKAVEVMQIVGHAMNLPDRTVEVLFIGDRAEVEEAQKAALEGPRYARVDSIDWEVVEGENVTAEGFRVG